MILSNHGSLRDLAEFYGVPFESRPVVSPESKRGFEERVLEVVEEHDVELVVLARYMQILSPSCARAWPAAPSTSTTRSCRASRARTRTSRRTPAASS